MSNTLLAPFTTDHVVAMIATNPLVNAPGQEILTIPQQVIYNEFFDKVVDATWTPSTQAIKIVELNNESFVECTKYVDLFNTLFNSEIITDPDLKTAYAQIKANIQAQIPTQGGN